MSLLPSMKFSARMISSTQTRRTVKVCAVFFL